LAEVITGQFAFVKYLVYIQVYVGHRRYHGFPHFFLDDVRIIQ
jgi:hypothetical protein